MDSSQYLALLHHARSVGFSDPSVDLTRLEQQLEDAVEKEGQTAPPDAERFATLFFASPEGQEYQRLTAHDPAHSLARDAALFSPTGVALPHSLAGKRVLMVDDQQCVINTVRHFLEMWGMEVVATTDSEEALRLLQTEDYDLLITDLVMPKLDGVNLLNKLIEANRFIPTLVLSGSQGNRQAALLHHELSNGILREMDLPLLYMKKESDHFEEGLQDRLTYLAKKPRFQHDQIAEEALPRLRSVVAQVTTSEELAGESVSDPQRRKLIELLIDILCDLRFSILVEASPILAEISAFASTLSPDDKFAKALMGIPEEWKQIPLRPRDELFSLDERGWHDFKNETQSYGRSFDFVLTYLNRFNGPNLLKEKVRAFKKRAGILSRISADIYSLTLAGHGEYVSDIFGMLHGDLKFTHLEKKVDISLPADSPLMLRLPSQFTLDMVTQLTSNALQATPSDAQRPLFHAAIVSADDPFSSMKVKPEPDDVLGKAHRPSPDEVSKKSTRYLFIACVNHGASLSQEIRMAMLAAYHFTTKEHGTGVGLRVLKENIKAVDGWLEVQSRDGVTEVAVFIPIDDRIVPNPPTSGGSPPGEGSGQSSSTQSSGPAAQSRPFKHKPDEPGVPDWTAARAAAGKPVEPPDTAPPKDTRCLREFFALYEIRLKEEPIKAPETFFDRASQGKLAASERTMIGLMARRLQELPALTDEDRALIQEAVRLFGPQAGDSHLLGMPIPPLWDEFEPALPKVSHNDFQLIGGFLEDAGRAKNDTEVFIALDHGTVLSSDPLQSFRTEGFASTRFLDFEVSAPPSLLQDPPKMKEWLLNIAVQYDLFSKQQAGRLKENNGKKFQRRAIVGPEFSGAALKAFQADLERLEMIYWAAYSRLKMEGVNLHHAVIIPELYAQTAGAVIEEAKIFFSQWETIYMFIRDAGRPLISLKSLIDGILQRTMAPIIHLAPSWEAAVNGKRVVDLFPILPPSSMGSAVATPLESKRGEASKRGLTLTHDIPMVMALLRMELIDHHNLTTVLNHLLERALSTVGPTPPKQRSLSLKVALREAELVFTLEDTIDRSWDFIHTEALLKQVGAKDVETSFYPGRGVRVRFAFPLEMFKPVEEPIIAWKGGGGKSFTPVSVPVDPSLSFGEGEPFIMHLEGDLPRMTAILPLQVRQEIERDDERFLSDLFGFGAQLKHLDLALHDEAHPGEAFLVARDIADTLFDSENKELNPSFKSHTHAVALLTVEALASHFDILNDYIGRKIFQDLSYGYQLLREDESKNLKKVEGILQEILLLDPYNPWALHLALYVATQLGDEVSQKGLRAQITKQIERVRTLPEKFQMSHVLRLLHKRAELARDKMASSVASGFSVYAGLSLVMNTVSHVVDGVIPGLTWLQHARQAVREVEDLAEAGPVATEVALEMPLFFGAYAEAVRRAPKKHLLVKTWEQLAQAEMVEQARRIYHLEEIPILGPHAVKRLELRGRLQAVFKPGMVLAIEDLPGAGKTYLASQLAHGYKKALDRLRGVSGEEGLIPEIFWHTFREGERMGLRQFFELLAYFLETKANHVGLLLRVQQEKKIEARVSLIIQALQRSNVLIVLDKFHLHLNDEGEEKIWGPLFDEEIGFSRILLLVTEGGYKDNWLARHQRVKRVKLDKMDEDEAKRLIEKVAPGHTLSEADFRSVYARSEGQPHALALMGEAIKTDPSGEYKRVDSVDDLYGSIYKGISVRAREVLKYLALFRRPVARKDLTLLLPDHQEAIDELQRAHLVEERTAGYLEANDRFKAYLVPHIDDAKERHARIAEYYQHHGTHREVDIVLEGAHHYFEAELYSHAVRIIRDRVREVSAQERLLDLEKLIERFDMLRIGNTDGIRLSLEDWAVLYFEQGSIHLLKGNLPMADQYYRMAAWTLQDLLQKQPETNPAHYHLLFRSYWMLVDVCRSRRETERSIHYHRLATELLEKINPDEAKVMAEYLKALTDEYHRRTPAPSGDRPRRSSIEFMVPTPPAETGKPVSGTERPSLPGTPRVGKPKPTQHRPDPDAYGIQHPDWTAARAAAGRNVASLRSPIRLVGGSDSLVNGGVTLVGSVPPAEEEEKGATRSKRILRPNRFVPLGIQGRATVVPLRAIPVGR